MAGWTYTGFRVVISEQVFQGLDAAAQEAFLAAGKSATEASAKFLQEQEESIKEELIAKGMKITEPANDEQEFIDLATSEVWPKFYDRIRW